MPTSGFILGKFLPLHRGHQFLINSALARVDRLSIIVYDNKAFSIPLAIRLGWLHELYPQVTLIPLSDLYDKDFTASETWHNHEQLLKSYLPSDVTHFFSSENHNYYDHLAQYLKVQHVVIDKDRRQVPVSGTQILANPEKYRDFLEPMVYNYLSKNSYLK